MKKIYTSLLTLMVACSVSSIAQTVTDFTKKDCNGQVHNLFNELNSGKAVIMEFFHTCSMCADAAMDIKPMYQDLVAKYGNKVLFYVMPEDDSYQCPDVLNWVNNVTALPSTVVPFDSGGVVAAYYGGMSMPTIAVVAGSAHKILYLVSPATVPDYFVTSDTFKISKAIRNFLDSAFAGIPAINSNMSVSMFPNPVSNNLMVTITVQEPGDLQLELETITGDKIAVLTEEKIQIGTWNRSFPLSLSNGIYFIKGYFNEKYFQDKLTVLH